MRGTQYRELVAHRGNEKFIYRYSDGDELKVLDAIADQRRRHLLDAITAAALCHRLGLQEKKK